jgi:hypothetical protein
VAGAEWASIAPRGNAGWLISDGALRFSPDLAKGEFASIPDSWPLPDQAIWAADGKATLLSGPRELALIRRDEGGQPRRESVFEPEAVGSLRLLGATGDLGQALLAIRSGEEGLWQLLLWTPGENPRRVGSANDPTGASFTARGESAYVADAGAKQVLRIGLGDGQETVVVLDEGDGVSEPAGILASQDGARIQVLEKSARVIRSYNLASREIVAELAMEESPEGLQAFGPASYLLNRRTRKAQPLLLLDLSGEPRVVFVPAGE